MLTDFGFWLMSGDKNRLAHWFGRAPRHKVAPCGKLPLQSLLSKIKGRGQSKVEKGTGTRCDAKLL